MNGKYPPTWNLPNHKPVNDRNPHFPALRLIQWLFQGPSPQKQFLSNSTWEVIKTTPIPSNDGLEEKIGWWQPPKGEVFIDRVHFDTSNGRTIRAVLKCQDGKLLFHLSYST